MPHILIVAASLRLLVIFATLRLHPASWFFDQATELAALGHSIVQGQGLSSPFGGSTGPSAFLSPGYPGFVALVFWLVGSYSRGSMIALMLAEAAFGVATVFALMLATRRLFGGAAAHLAGWIWAASPVLLFLPTLFWETSLSIFLVTAVFALSLEVASAPRVFTWACLATLVAMSLLVNPALLGIVVCCCAWAALQRPLANFRLPLAAALLCLVLYAPWPARNVEQMHTMIVARSNLGYELWQGSQKGADGYFSASLHPNVNQTEFQRYAEVGEVRYMAEKKALARRLIRDDLAGFAATSTRRVLRFWIGTGRQSGFFVIVHIAATSIFGVAGSVLLWVRGRRRLAILFMLPLLFFPLPYYVTHSDFRFRLVLDPLLTMLAAHTITSFAGRPRIEA